MKAALVALVPSTVPGGDAMTARFHCDAEAALLKRENVRRPRAWQIHPDDVARFAMEGKHCETRRCRNPVSVATWQYWRSAAAGRVLVTEHFVCDAHGAGFAQRHHIEMEPPPPAPSRHSTPGGEERSR